MAKRKLAEELGHQLYLFRKRRGIRLRDLAGRVGLSTGSLSKIERGIQFPPWETLLRLISGLGLNPRECSALFSNFIASFLEGCVPSLEKGTQPPRKLPVLLLVIGRYFKREEVLHTLSQLLEPILEGFAIEPFIAATPQDPTLPVKISQAALVIDATGLFTRGSWKFIQQGEPAQIPLTQAGLLALRGDVPYILLSRYQGRSSMQISGWIRIDQPFSSPPADREKAISDLKNIQLDPNREEIICRYYQKRSREALEEAAALSNDFTFLMYLASQKLIERCIPPPTSPEEWSLIWKIDRSTPKLEHQGRVIQPSKEYLYKGGHDAIFNVIREYHKNDPTPHIYIEQLIPGVYILPLTRERKIILIQQYRYPLKKHMWEIPAGAKEEGETLEEAARRELEEETGYRAKRLVKLLTFHPSPGLTSSCSHLFLAMGLKRFSNPAPKIEGIMPVELSQALKMIEEGKITQAGAVIGILCVVNLFKTKVFHSPRP